MIDFALDAERNEGKAPREAIHQAALLRFRPILMTTLAALFARAAADARLRRGLGAAPAARPRDLRRPDRQPAADAVHHAGDLPRVRPAGAGGCAACRSTRRPIHCRRRRAPTPAPRAAADEPLGALHPPAGRHDAADDRRGAGRHRRPSSCCRWRRCRRSTSRPSRCQRQPAGRQPRDHGDQRRHAARAPPRRDRRRHRDDLDQLASARRAITLQFDLDRDIDGAARDVQAAINAARADLPATLRSNPTYRKVNPADAPVMILALTSDDADAGPDLRRGVERRCSRSCSQVRASATSRSAAARCRRCASSCNPFALNKLRHRPARTCAPRSRRPTPTGPRARSRTATQRCRSTPTTRRARPPTTRR